MSRFRKDSAVLKKGALAILIAAIILAPFSSVPFPFDSPSVAYAQTQTATGAAAGGGTQPASSNAVSCAGDWNYVSHLGTCLFRSFVSLAAATLIYIASWFLVVASMLFDWVVNNTILHFGSLYTSGVQTAVESAWSAFRDIANILIIGIFTFIALSIIVGLEKFGQKKLIARVLVIAVLVNFSLLFTKLVVDASNFTASQLYAAAGFNALQQGDQQQGGASVREYGIGGQFINLLGIGTFTDTKKALDKIAEATDNGWIAFLHGLFVFFLVLGATAVLLYGSFLIISRAILIIILMVTASVAFASYLIPNWAESRYGWNTWLSSLLKSAVFAPLLLFLLWMTLKVSSAMHATMKGSFGDMIANPTSVPDTNTLFSYLLILGLLFVSFKLSNVFAGKIAGFNFATNLAAAPFTLGNRFLAAPFLRQTVGWIGYKYQQSRVGQARGYRDTAARYRILEAEAVKKGDQAEADKQRGLALEQEKLAQMKLKRAARYGKVAESRMNIMDTGMVKKAAGAMGITATGESPKGTQGKADQIKTRVEAAEKLAAKVAPSGEDLQNAREKVRRERLAERNKRAQDFLNAERMRDTIRTSLEAAQAGSNAAVNIRNQNSAQKQREIETERDNVARGNPEYARGRTEIEGAEREKTTINANRDQIANEIRVQLDQTADGAARARLERELGTSEERRASELRHQAERIEQARSRMKEFEENSPAAQRLRDLQRQQTNQLATDQAEVDKAAVRVNELNTKISQADADVGKARKGLNEWDDETKRLSDAITDAMKNAATSIAEKVGEKQGDVLTRRLGSLTGENKEVGRRAKDLYTNKIKTANLRDVIASVQAETPPPTAPVSPPPPGKTP